MRDDPAWDRLVDAVDVKFGIERHGKETRPLEDRTDLTEEVSFIVFHRDGARLRLERVARPAVIDRKSHYHRAAGSGVRFENVYDPKDITLRTRLLIEKDGDWEEIDPDSLTL